MQAMVLSHALRSDSQAGTDSPLEFKEIPQPIPGSDDLLIQVEACAVCRTDLHIVDGELTKPKLPLVIGHEIVGIVKEIGSSASEFKLGDRVGVPWLGGTCQKCSQCKCGRENLCDNPTFTGYTRDGGYAEFAVANSRYCFKIPDSYKAATAAPLLCAGLIGWRSYKMAIRAVDLMADPAADIAQRAKGLKLGLYGFGAAAHILAQVAIFQGSEVYAFTRSGDESGMRFARDLGCKWAGSSDDNPPQQLDAAIIFAPIGALVPAALKAVRKGGAIICGGIHMSDIPSFPYDDLWCERKILSVANLTRQDAIEFLEIAPKVPVKTTVTPYPLRQANEALNDLRHGKLNGAAVLTTDF